MQPTTIVVVLMVLGTGAKIASLFRITIDRLARRYPLFTLMTVLSAARTIALLWVMGVGETMRLYPLIWRRTEGITLALQAAACIEAFWILALHFRNIKAFGTILLTLIGALSATLCCCVVAGWSGRWTTPFTSAAILMQRVGLTLVVIALCSRMFFRLFPTVPVRPNALRHLTILALLFSSFFISGFANGIRWTYIANAAVTFGVFAAYTWWTIFMTPKGEELPFLVPQPLSPEEFEAADSVDRRKMEHAVRGAGAIHDQLR